MAHFTSFPEEVRNLRQISSLDMNFSDMDGLSIPDWLSELANLEHLGLYACGLTGNIPESLGNLKKLVLLELGVNSLSGQIPSTFSNLTNLVSLNIKNNRLSGEIPETIVNMPWFRYTWGELISGNNFDFGNIVLSAPEFTVTDINGNTIDAAQVYKDNKYTILYQYRPSECGITTRQLKSYYNQYHDNGLDVIAWTGDSVEEIIACNTPWKNFRRAQEGNWFYQNDYTYLGRTITHYVDSYPMFYVGSPSITVVDTDGKVVWSNSFSDTSLGFFLDSKLTSPDYYISTDYSQDGKVATMQSATKGKGINVVLMGDAYSDRQIADGTYGADMKYIYDNLFTEEPYKSFKDYFNVYSVNVVSATEGYDHGGASLGGYFGAGTLVGGNDKKCFEYAVKAVGEQNMDEALVVVAMNSDNYAGTCYMYYPSSTNGTYGSGTSVAYFPKGGDKETFARLLHHEACGHGFAKLADEYAYESMGTVPSDYVSQTQTQQNNWGWWKNVDFTNDLSAVRWSRFISDSRYADEGLGAFEGGLTYWSGVWRPTENSIMRHNTGGFNAPSREAIYYRIHKLAYGDSWEYDYENFVKYDEINRKASSSAHWNAFNPENYRPLHPPVVVGKSWKDVTRE